MRACTSNALQDLLEPLHSDGRLTSVAFGAEQVDGVWLVDPLRLGALDAAKVLH